MSTQTPANAAKAAAAGTKTDFKSLLASSLSESRHDPTARNKRSTAAGAFQFTERTWLSLVQRHGAGDTRIVVAGQIHTAAAFAAATSVPARPRIRWEFVPYDETPRHYRAAPY